MEDKYSGIEEGNFEHKYKIFKKRCDQNGVEEMERPKAFSIMLTGRALQFYFENYQEKRVTIDDLYNGLRKRFKMKEHVRALLREWDSINLAKSCPSIPTRRTRNASSYSSVAYRTSSTA